MVKVVMVVPRRADLTHAAFIAHLSTKHLAVVDEVPEFRDRVRAYMQNHLILEPARLGVPGDFPLHVNADAIMEIVFDNVAAIQQAFQEPRYLEIIRPDELAFGDVAGAWGLTTDEVPIAGNERFRGHAKLFIFLKRRTGLSHGDFMSLWSELRDRGVMASPEFHHVGRLVENRVKQDPAERLPGMQDYDVVAELWFESHPILVQFATRVQLPVLLRADMLDTAYTRVYVAEEKPESAQWLRRSQARV
jgi:hypothetical protein